MTSQNLTTFSEFRLQLTHVGSVRIKENKRMSVYISVYVYDNSQLSLESVLKQSNGTKQDQRTYIASDTATGTPPSCSDALVAIIGTVHHSSNLPLQYPCPNLSLSPLLPPGLPSEQALPWLVWFLPVDGRLITVSSCKPLRVGGRLVFPVCRN